MRILDGAAVYVRTVQHADLRTVHTVLRISIDLLYDSYSIVLLYVIDGQKRRACLLLLVS